MKSLKEKLIEKIEAKAIPEISVRDKNVFEEAFPETANSIPLQIVLELFVSMTNGVPKITLVNQKQQDIIKAVTELKTPEPSITTIKPDELPVVLTGIVCASKKELEGLISVVNEKKISIAKIKKMLLEKYNVSNSKFLTPSQVEDFKAYLADIKK